MKTNFKKCRIIGGNGQVYIQINQNILDHLKWSVGDEVMVDIPTHGPDLIVYKEAK